MVSFLSTLQCMLPVCSTVSTGREQMGWVGFFKRTTKNHSAAAIMLAKKAYIPKKLWML